jgi:hypothetical protein
MQTEVLRLRASRSAQDDRLFDQFALYRQWSDFGKFSKGPKCRRLRKNGGLGLISCTPTIKKEERIRREFAFALEAGTTLKTTSFRLSRAC